MHDKDETQLIRRAQTGDEDAFVILHQRHWEDIFRFIYFRVDSQAVAEDLTSDVFVKMVEKIESYRFKGKPLLAWLYTIARHLVIDHYRKNGSKPKFTQLDERIDAGDKGDPIKLTNRQLAADCLRRALAHLTELQRDVITGKFIDQRSNKEVAQLLGRTEGAIKSLQHRALNSLKRAIEKEKCYEP
ncbi:MAG: sigma-70 family RNA polymerase sigma factor [Anaerolineales bacterium]